MHFYHPLSIKTHNNAHWKAETKFIWDLQLFSIKIYDSLWQFWFKNLTGNVPEFVWSLLSTCKQSDNISNAIAENNINACKITLETWIIQIVIYVTCIYYSLEATRYIGFVNYMQTTLINWLQYKHNKRLKVSVAVLSYKINLSGVEADFLPQMGLKDVRFWILCFSDMWQCSNSMFTLQLCKTLNNANTPRWYFTWLCIFCSIYIEKRKKILE